MNYKQTLGSEVTKAYTLTVELSLSLILKKFQKNKLISKVFKNWKSFFVKSNVFIMHSTLTLPTDPSFRGWGKISRWTEATVATNT